MRSVMLLFALAGGIGTTHAGGACWRHATRCIVLGVKCDRGVHPACTLFRRCVAGYEATCGRWWSTAPADDGRPPSINPKG